MDPMKKKFILETKANKYKSMDPYKKYKLLKEKAQKYKSAGLKEKKACLQKNRQRVKYKYKIIDPLKKANQLEKCKKARDSKADPLFHDLDHYISRFHNKIKEGPYYICSVCNRLLYKKSVMLLHKNKYVNANESLFTDVKSFDENEYICKTCH